MVLFFEKNMLCLAVQDTVGLLSHVAAGSIVSCLGGLDMARGRKTALTIRLTPAQHHTLLAWQRATTISAGCARRGRIILLLAEQMPIAKVAATVGISRRFVYKWAQRFVEAGLDGLADKPGRGHRRVQPMPTLAEAHAVSA
jgi:Helix-turn-helix domain